jgi:hypothetical protein
LTTDFDVIVPVRIKRATETKPFTIDWKSYLRSYWIASRRYAQNDIVRSPSISGFAYQAQNAGEAGGAEPNWPRLLGGTTTDGSITWAAIAPGTNAVDTISATPTWSQVNPPDAALTIGAVTNTVEETTAPFSAGTPGATYRIACTIVTSGGNSYTQQFDLEVG